LAKAIFDNSISGGADLRYSVFSLEEKVQKRDDSPKALFSSQQRPGGV